MLYQKLKTLNLSLSHHKEPKTLADLHDREITRDLIRGAVVDISTHLNKCFSPVLRGGESLSGILLSERLSRLN